MLEAVITIDYEVYGHGEGSLRELVFDPAKRLKALFEKRNARFVAFVEAAELERIAAEKTDPAISLVQNQVREFHRDGFEVGLHLHPQWYNARRENGRWRLDYREYNLCTLPRERIVGIVDRALAYLRTLVGDPAFTPVSFRAGNWLFQPTRTAAGVLCERGLQIDSSVFKGGRQHQHRLDYRRALKNGSFWRFSDDVNVPDPGGGLVEFPIFTKMVPTWKLFTAKRIGLQRKAPAAPPSGGGRLSRIRDFLRLRSPLKLDFCRMTIDELGTMLDAAVREDRRDPASFRPIVAIGHTKDLVDFGAVEAFLSGLRERGIPVSTFGDMIRRTPR
jgi:hypothetical protein